MANIEKLLADQTAKLTGVISALDEKLSAKLDSFDQRITALEAHCTNNTQNITTNTISINNVKLTATTNLNDINSIQTELSTVATDNHERDTRINKLDDDISSLRVKVENNEQFNAVHTEFIEDQMNRSLRKNIIIRGIPEGNNETWEDTRAIVANALGAATKINPNQVGDMFERIHRGSAKEGDDKKFPRTIFALLYNWNNVDVLMSELRKHGKGSNIYIDQQYGPITTYRRKLALNARKELKDAKTITSGFVKFPAKLMVKNGPKAKYFVQQDFSKVQIPQAEYLKHLKEYSVSLNR